MKKYFFVFIFFGLTNFSSALSPLPANAYLRLGDNERAVKTLQEILNSNPTTQIAETGPGSPGNENWYFGKLTEYALKIFQEINSLQVTGQIDFKTWKKINDYVTGNLSSTNFPSNTNLTNTNVSEKVKLADEKRISINEQNKKDFEASKKTSLEKAQTDQALKSEESKSYLQSLIDKYAGFFYTTKGDASTQTTTQTTPTQETYSNNYSAQTPYLNPNTGIYSSSPSSAQQVPQQTSGQPISSQGQQLSGNPYLPATQNPYLNNNQQPSFMNGLSQGLGYNQVTSGRESSAGKIGGSVGRIGQCIATTFAHATMVEGCRADGNDQQNSQKSASGVVLSRIGVPAIPAVAIWAGSLGDAIEVKDMATGKCKAFPILDRGPDQTRLNQGKCLDLTGSAYDILKGNQPCKDVTGPLLYLFRHSIPKVQYAIVPGEKIQPGQTKECSHLTGSSKQ